MSNAQAKDDFNPIKIENNGNLPPGTWYYMLVLKQEDGRWAVNTFNNKTLYFDDDHLPDDIKSCLAVIGARHPEETEMGWMIDNDAFNVIIAEDTIKGLNGDKL